jgi:hypothetical protein
MARDREIKKTDKANGNCHHPYLKKGKITGEKVCVSCGRTVYCGQINEEESDGTLVRSLSKSA